MNLGVNASLPQAPMVTERHHARDDDLRANPAGGADQGGVRSRCEQHATISSQSALGSETTEPRRPGALTTRPRQAGPASAGNSRGGLDRRFVLVLRQPAGCLGGLVVVHDDLLPGRVVLVDLLEQLLDEILGGDLLERLALGVDDARVLASSDPEVGGRASPIPLTAELSTETSIGSS
jgi:hypothetical protein